MVIVFGGAPPRSGPNCEVLGGTCIEYPYTDAAEHVPEDFFWMVPAFLLGPLFVVVAAYLLRDRVGTGAGSVVARLGVTFAAMAATVLMVDYYIQFTTVQASLVRGEVEGGLSLLSQYNPHGIFIALEDLGYPTMLASFVLVGLALNPGSGLERGLRRVLILSGTLGVMAFVLLVGLLGRHLEYWYELVGLSLSWTVLAATGVLASLLLRREAGSARSI
jgi:hypothetical protein